MGLKELHAIKIELHGLMDRRIEINVKNSTRKVTARNNFIYRDSS